MRRPTFTYSAGDSSYYGGGNNKLQVRMERESGSIGSSGGHSGNRCQTPNFAPLHHSKVIVDQRSLRHIQDSEPNFEKIKCKSSDQLKSIVTENRFLRMDDNSVVITSCSTEMGTSCIKQDNCFTNSSVKATSASTKIKDMQKVKQTDCENKIVSEVVSIEPCFVQNSKNNYQHYLRNKMGCGVIVDSEVQVYGNCEPHKVSHNTVISVVELQKPRKRKERQDSTSSITQERKLVRSNSEERINEVITNPSERIRRVVSHEDFKKYPNHKPSNSSSLPLHEHNSRDDSYKKITEPNYGIIDSPAKFNDFSNNFSNSELLNDFQKYRKNDSSPARSRFNDFSPKLRISPNRDIYLPKRDGGNDSEEYECEHEKRRNSERFSRARLVPGRKAPSKSRKGGSKSSKVMKHVHDENDYMNTNFLKEKDSRSEQMKFVNKDYFYGHSSKKSEHVSLSAEKGKRRHHEDIKIDIPDRPLAVAEKTRSMDDQKSLSESVPSSTPKTADNKIQNTNFPWDQPTEPMPSYHSVCIEDSEQVVPCSKNECDVKKPQVVDQVVKMTECHARKYEYHSNALKDVEGSSRSDLESREFIAKTKTPNFLTPENRLKQITKRISSLKKKITKYEEIFEQQNGYRASQADKLADKNIKKIYSEMQKLRKEKMQLRIDPMSAILSFKQNGSEMANLGSEEASCPIRQENMRETLNEIEKRLCEKRSKCNRPFDLEQMTFNQLMDEKIEIQKALLYLESLYGHPASREARDIAHPIYDRYRLVKRMVARGNSCKLNSSVSELQTILEHEAMDFIVSESHLPLSEAARTTPQSSCLYGIQQQIEDLNIKEQQTDRNNEGLVRDIELQSQEIARPYLSLSSSSSVLSIKPDILKMEKSLSLGSKIDESPPSLKSTDSNSTSSSSVNENLHILPLEELKQQLILTRDEKKQLRRTIKEYEHDFVDINGRKMQKDDRIGMESTYALYKQIKAKLRLLQALVNKHKFN